jgi:autotransporter translocation and assembly factor TamB
VNLQEFKLLDRHGEQLRVAGQLAVHEKRVGAVNISIDSDNFEALNNELGDVQLQTALKISGELRRPRVEGTINVDAGRLEVDRILERTYSPYAVESMPDVVSAERTVEGEGSAEDATKNALSKASASAAAPGAEQKAAEDEAEAAAAPPSGTIADAVAVDLHVTIPDNLVLRGKDLRPGGPTGTKVGDLNITLGGDVRVRKDPGGPPTLLGVVNTVRGTYEFMGRRFDLERDGTVRFIGTSTINPTLDIRATRKIPNTGVTARVHITGTPKAPQLDLTSDPPLEESDILALIVFNRPVNELGTGERSSLAATAGGIATGFIAAPLGESIGKALDLDLFEISTTTESGDLGAVITLGQQIDQRTFLKMRQEFRERSTTEFQLEYQIARFLRAQVSAAPETSGSANRINERRVERAGIDLIFFFSY